MAFRAVLLSGGRFGAAGAVFLTAAALAAAAAFGAGFFCAGFLLVLALVAVFAGFFILLAETADLDRATAAFADAFDALAGLAAFDFFFDIALVPPRGTGT
jgi:hypothetical protein